MLLRKSPLLRRAGRIRSSLSVIRSRQGLFVVAGRANWMLRNLTKRNFGYVRPTTSEEELSRLQQKWTRRLSGEHMIQIKMGESSRHSPCQDCGEQTLVVWGYVYEDGNAHAVYYASWTPGHLERGAQLIVSIEGWGEGSDASKRSCVAVNCLMGEDRPGYMVINASESMWGHETFLGSMLSRNQALETGVSQQAFQILDRIAEEDQRFKAFLLKSP